MILKEYPDNFRAGYAAIIGEPNVGKSTLMNTFLKQKLSIVSPKPQTTRNLILGIKNGEDHQIIFLDTPGLITPKYQLQKALVKSARTSIYEADLILMMVDIHTQDSQIETIIKDIKLFETPKFLLINKIDLCNKDDLLPLIEKFSKTGIFKQIIPVSALKNDGLDILLSCILENIPKSHPFYPQDIISSEPERFFVAEIIREKIFFLYQKEIPYSTAVKILDFKEREGRKDYIRAVIIVERNSQKGILIGKKGKALKKVGMVAREDIEHFLERPVYLELKVRVSKNWRKDPIVIKGLGY